MSPVQHFAGRLRVLDPDMRRLELLLSAGDSGTFICRGRPEAESRTVLQVLGDGAYCRAPGPSQGTWKPPCTGEVNSDTHSRRGGGLGWGFLSWRASCLSSLHGPQLSPPPSAIAPGSVYPQLLIPLLGAGLVLGLGALGVVWWQRR